MTKVTTTTLDLITLDALGRHGWDKGQPCLVDLYLTGNVPTFEVSSSKGLNTTIALAFDIKCMKHSDSTEYDQVFTVVTNEIDFTGSVSVHQIYFLNMIYFSDQNHAWILSINSY